MMNKKLIGFLLMVVAAFGLASATIFFKLLQRQAVLPPAHVAIWRFSIAAPLMLLVLVLKKPAEGFFSRRLWSFLLLGLVFSICNFSAVFAIDRVDPSLYVIILYIYPSLVVLYALLKGNPIPRLSWLGLPMTLSGLVLVTIDFNGALTLDPVGLGITLLNAVGLAVYLILSESVFQKSGSRLLGTTWMALGAMLVGWLTMPALGISLPQSRDGWLLIVALGIFGTLLPLLTMNIGLQLVGAARGSLVNTLQPVIAVLFSTLFLGDRLRLQQWVGGALVILAVILLQISPDNRSSEKEGTVSA